MLDLSHTKQCIMLKMECGFTSGGQGLGSVLNAAVYKIQASATSSPYH